MPQVCARARATADDDDSPPENPAFTHKHTDDPLVASIAQQYLADRKAHDKTAAEWTRRYATG
jgi:hypothetical protein